MVRDERRVALVPATDIDYDRVQRLPRGWPIQMHATYQRTTKLNRWYRGIVSKAADGLGAHHQALHNELKLKAGLVEQVLAFGSMPGMVSIKLRSTAFPEMEDLEFSDYCDFAIPCLFRDHIPGIRAPAQRKLITEWAGRRPKLELPPKLTLPLELQKELYG